MTLLDELLFLAQRELDAGREIMPVNCANLIEAARREREQHARELLACAKAAGCGSR